jgi:hypothetical protein
LIIAARMQIAVFTTKYAATTAQSSPKSDSGAGHLRRILCGFMDARSRGG